VGKDKDLKVGSIGQAIMQAARPRILQAPLVLGVQMHFHFASRFLIDTVSPGMMNRLLNEVGSSPAKFQVTSPIGTLHRSSRNRIKQKFRDSMNAMKQHIANVLCPEQEDRLLKLVGEMQDSDDDEDDEALEHLIDIFKQVPEHFKIHVLSVAPLDKYTKDELMGKFGCLRYMIDAARKYTKLYGPLKHDEPEKQDRRDKLDMTKVEDFLDFLRTALQ
jgi:hypothetical protein